MNENEMDGLTGYEWFRGELSGHPSTCVYLISTGTAHESRTHTPVDVAHVVIAWQPTPQLTGRRKSRRASERVTRLAVCAAPRPPLDPLAQPLRDTSTRGVSPRGTYALLSLLSLLSLCLTYYTEPFIYFPPGWLESTGFCHGQVVNLSSDL